MDVASLELPDGVREILAADNITTLYPPQAEAIPFALAGKNLVLSCPTASGKSLVGYLALVKQVLAGGKGLYIVPLRALAAEKFRELQQFSSLGIRVGISMGDFDSPEVGLQRYDIVVATSEKADSLLRHRSEWLEKVTCIVADELHLLHDRDRGPTLEVTLSRFLQQNPNTQIIGLSATIANSEIIAEWLRASHVRSTWRPVPLRTGVCVGGQVLFADGDIRRLGSSLRGAGTSKTTESAALLAVDVLDDGGQCLVFTSSRKSAESMAEALCVETSSRLTPAEREALAEVARRVLKGESTGVGEVLARTVRCGVAFHHAGLAHHQREAIEDSFRRRTLKVITATPTLAMGINLPARRVVVRDTKRYESAFRTMEYLPIMEIQQMIGRAGRPRYDKTGEAILVAHTAAEGQYLTEEYLLADPEEITSKLGVPSTFRVHVLSSIATGYAHTIEDLSRFLKSTFYFIRDKPRAPMRLVKECVRFLTKEGFVAQDGDQLRPTAFGKRTSDLYLDPMSAITLRDALRKAASGGAHLGELGILHAVCSAPDLARVGGYLRRGEFEKMEEVLARHESEMLLPIPDGFEEREEFLLHLRNALILREWTNEVPVGTLTEAFDIGPGDVRARVETSQWILYGMRELARQFHVPAVGPIATVEARVKAGAKEELLDLVRLRGVGRVRARALFTAGYRTRSEVGAAPADRLGLVKGIGPTLAASLLRQLTGAEVGAVVDEEEF